MSGLATSKMKASSIGSAVENLKSCDFIEISGNDGVWRTTGAPLRIDLPLMLRPRIKRIIMIGLGYTLAGALVLLLITKPSIAPSQTGVDWSLAIPKQMDWDWALDVKNELPFFTYDTVAWTLFGAFFIGAGLIKFRRAINGSIGISFRQDGFIDPYRGTFIAWSSIRGANRMPRSSSIALYLKRAGNGDGVQNRGCIPRGWAGFIIINADEFDIPHHIVIQTVNGLIERSASTADLQEAR